MILSVDVVPLGPQKNGNKQIKLLFMVKTAMMKKYIPNIINLLHLDFTIFLFIQVDYLNGSYCKTFMESKISQLLKKNLIY